MTVSLASLLGVSHVAGQVQAPSPTAAARVARPDEPPELPDFIGTLVNFARSGDVVAVCTIDREQPVRRIGARTIPPTHVWVLEHDLVRQLGITTGACDPAWSPNGERLAVVQPNGLWTYSAMLDDPRQLAATRLPVQPQHESDYTAFQRPGWSPDGKFLAYVVTNGATSWVEVVEVSSGRTRLKSPQGPQQYRWEAERATIVIDGRSTSFP